MKKENLAFKLVLIAIAVVLTAIWLSTAAYTWPKANELIEVHNLPYPKGADLGSFAAQTYPETFRQNVQAGVITQPRTTRVVVQRNGDSNYYPPYELVLQGVDKEGRAWETQIMGEVSFLNFGGIYPTYSLDQATMSENQVTIKLRLTDSWWHIYAGIAVIWLFLAACLAVFLRDL